ncbi:hypothetical protein [Caballeronia sp. ATUFL_F2_KS9A]|uniref:hypothetical protein n=1 Tax=Caballeronia sp. ATUFL_F2_KS9A TaxID=2921777 RepID=UPI002028F6F0|nr:hypothetical protein [Caballeronia sp. ATUFL_F2_KS9A]
MSMDWRIPSIPEFKHWKYPSPWIPAVALIVVVIAGFILTILNWKQGEAILSGTFFLFALVVPLLLWGAFCALLYQSYEDWNTRVDWWNYLCKDHFADWRDWARWDLALLDTVTLTPEVQLAERMAALDGTPPANGGKSPKLAQRDFAALLTQLVEPLMPHLARFAGKSTIHIALQTSHETHVAQLRGVLQALEVPNLEHIAVSRVEANECSALLDTWMTNQTARYDYDHDRRKRTPDLCLLLACQLQEEGAAPCTEAAVALLFASWNLLREKKLKPKARLFRSMPTTTDDIPDAIKTLVTAEPTPVKRLKHMWISGLSKPDGHVMRAAVKDSEPELTLLDLDHAIGLPGPASPLLMQALAAELMQYGQGPQVVVTPAAEGVRLNLIGKDYAPIARAVEPNLSLIQMSTSYGFVCLTVLLLILGEAGEFGPGWFRGIAAAGLVFLLIVQPAAQIFKRRTVTQEFYERARSGG